ncbi:MAG TPA: IPT/TIG domain-containing protein [Terriglobales bacterium]|jgi:IPT/TIG domain|nr:IPT/TIG domain-containing protein [Terriglobales bacterium]
MKTIALLSLVVLSVGCGYSSSNSKPSPGTVPTIAALAPDNTNAGTAGLTLTINGSSFNSDAVVKWNGTAQGTSFVSGNQLTAAIAATDLATAGTASVTVTNPGHPGGGMYGSGGTTAQTSNSMTFTIN